MASPTERTESRRRSFASRQRLALPWSRGLSATCFAWFTIGGMAEMKIHEDNPLLSTMTLNHYNFG